MGTVDRFRVAYGKRTESFPRQNVFVGTTNDEEFLRDATGAAAARLAELGCTEFEIMAITGHQTSKEVTRYTKAASQKIRAASALVKMTAERK